MATRVNHERGRFTIDFVLSCYVKYCRDFDAFLDTQVSLAPTPVSLSSAVHHTFVFSFCQ